MSAIFRRVIAPADFNASQAAQDTAAAARLAAQVALDAAQDARTNVVASLFYSPEQAGAVGDGTTNDRTALQAAVDYCLANNIKELRSRRVFAVSGPIDISNFDAGFRLVLGGLVAHASFPAPSNWKNAQPLLRIGNVGGNQVALNVNINQVNGGGKADALLITNNGCGGSNFNFDRAQDCNIIVKLAGNTFTTASNYFTGSYWYNSKLAGYVLGAGGVCEGTMFDVGFITDCIYGGLWFGDKTQYANVRGQLDFNGKWLTETQVTTIAGFAIGDAVNNGSGQTAEVLAAYISQGAYFLLLIEPRATVNGTSTFSIGNGLNNGTATTQIVGIRSTNQNADNRFFDIVSALTPGNSFWRARIDCAYLGGIVGSNLWNSTVLSGNSASSTTNWIQGLQVFNSGTTLSMTDKRASDTPFLDVTDTLFAPKRDLYLGANPVYGLSTSQSVPSGTVFNFFTLPTAGPNGAIWNISVMCPSDIGLRAKATVYIGANNYTAFLAADTQVSMTLTLSGNTVQINHGAPSARVFYMTLTRVL